MSDGSVTIIIIFELFKQTAFIGADKISAGSEGDAINSFMNN